jgi:integrase
VDLIKGTVHVPRKLAALRNRMEFGPPKSDAGTRTVALPKAAVAALRPHMLEHVKAEQEALVFTGEKGAVLRSGNFRRAVKWAAAVRKAGMPAGFTFHDLRHTGNHLASSSGASTRELMHRMGHSSMRAALIYQHATSDRDREIAESIDERIATERTGKPKRPTRRKKAGPEGANPKPTGRRKKDKDDPDDGTAGVPARVG